MKLIFLVLLCLASTWGRSSSPSYQGFSVLRVELSDREASKRLDKGLENLVEFWSHLPGKHADVMVSPDLKVQVEQRLIDEGFKFSTMIPDISNLMALEKVKAANAKIPAKADHPMTWDSYHSLEDINAYLDYLEKTYPDLVTIETIGESYEKRTMRVVKICKNGCGDKTALWIDGGIHAREWISPATVTFMIHQLVEVQDPSDADLIENLDWYILPVVNPDGYEHTRDSDRLWRKTRSRNGGICRGADANRNYGYHFNDGGSSGNTCSETYHGPEAFSEVENRNIRDFILAHKDQLKFFNSVHSYSQLILLPWGFTEEPIPNYDKLFALTTEANKALYAVHQIEYEVGCIPCLLYIASGGSMDWALGEAGIPYSIGMELRDTGLYGFLLPPAQIIPTGEETFAFHKSVGQQLIKEFGEAK